MLCGRLVLTRRELARSMAELRAAQEHQRELRARASAAPWTDCATWSPCCAPRATPTRNSPCTPRPSPCSTACTRPVRPSSSRSAAPGTVLEATGINTPARQPALGLPSARHGLLGLGERAEHLDGSLSHGPTPTGGYRLHLRLPGRRLGEQAEAEAELRPLGGFAAGATGERS
ncbi:hypothetical protein ACFV0H_17255 [Streptomyces erythrochromogenes]|uniref:Uncharacterized protein n=1 Tax=Streptomyces erythrochromogenes TaxID=285574 RepID=A0ABZ1QMQ8_9ACTN|nr:hypothetical protein [Streptomyces erythrochromogenes]